MFQTVHDVALMLDREQSGRDASPSGCIVDSQSVKAPAAEQRGYDGGKKLSIHPPKATGSMWVQDFVGDDGVERGVQ